MSESGTGFGPMGIIKTNWFTDRHEEYTAHMIPLDRQPVPQGQVDPYYTYEYWPIPTAWQVSVFRSDLWDTYVRNMGSNATQMGPITYGTRTLNKDRYEVAKYSSISNTAFESVGYYDELVPNNSMTDQEKVEMGFELGRRHHTSAIMRRQLNTIRSIANMDDVLYERSVEEVDSSDTSDEESDPQPAPTFDYPRYLEISEYLFDNRNPLELALDTMDFDMPEATLYRYIQNRGGLAISPQEFRNFLIYADSQNDLFR
jgi:hypothetical protein